MAGGNDGTDDRSGESLPEDQGMVEEEGADQSLKVGRSIHLWVSCHGVYTRESRQPRYINPSGNVTDDDPTEGGVHSGPLRCASWPDFGTS